MANALIPPGFLVPGTIVNAPMKGWLGLTRHFAIVTAKRGADGLPIVVANARESGGPAAESWSTFTGGLLRRACSDAQLGFRRIRCRTTPIPCSGPATI